MYAYVGLFTTAKRKARGDGIHVYRVDAATGAWTHVLHIGDLTEPSFLALSPDQRCLYAVHGDCDYATAFAIDRDTGQARLLNRATTGGNSIQSRPRAGPRHLAFHPTLPIVWVLNELDSTTTTYRWVGARGRLAPSQVITTLPTNFTGIAQPRRLPSRPMAAPCTVPIAVTTALPSIGPTPRPAC